MPVPVAAAGSGSDNDWVTVRPSLVVCAACAACYGPAPTTGSPCSLNQPCPSELVCSPATKTCERSAVIPDAASDTLGPAVVGDGTVSSPFVAVAGVPASCAAFLASY